MPKLAELPTPPARTVPNGRASGITAHHITATRSSAGAGAEGGLRRPDAQAARRTRARTSASEMAAIATR